MDFGFERLQPAHLVLAGVFGSREAGRVHSVEAVMVPKHVELIVD